MYHILTSFKLKEDASLDALRMSFKDRERCDRSVELIYELGANKNPAHVATYDKIVDAVFVCWENIE